MNPKSKSPVPKAGMAKKKQAVTAKEARMDLARDSSKFKGLATVVEMMMEYNCAPSLHMSDGIGTDNMTCIIVEFNRPDQQNQI